jgi:hypothetical protein
MGCAPSRRSAPTPLNLDVPMDHKELVCRRAARVRAASRDARPCSISRRTAEPPDWQVYNPKVKKTGALVPTIPEEKEPLPEILKSAPSAASSTKRVSFSSAQPEEVLMPAPPPELTDKEKLERMQQAAKVAESDKQAAAAAASVVAAAAAAGVPLASSPGPPKPAAAAPAASMPAASSSSTPPPPPPPPQALPSSQEYGGVKVAGPKFSPASWLGGSLSLNIGVKRSTADALAARSFGLGDLNRPADVRQNV